ncbi:MAG: hypothetical protein KIS67_14115 [Verrucomicrobiae bacterium]|nr:hypothetical protein [Verrucomicrobiae bacterium]
MSDALKDPPVTSRSEEYQSPYSSLADEIYRGKVLRARATSPEDKFLAGEELFEYACSITLAGIQSQNPEFTEDDCRRELKRRLKLRERMERQS